MLVGIEAAHAQKGQRTGVEEYCFQIIQHLKKVVPAEVRVVLYVRNQESGIRNQWGDLARNLPSNWEIKVLRWPLGKLWSQGRLSVELFLHRPDVFFAPGQLVPFFTPRKTVATIHDSAFLVFPRVYRFLGRQYLRAMNWWILRRASTIITPSQFTKNELKRLYPWFAEKYGVVIPLACDRERFTAIPKEGDVEVLRKLGITKPFFLFVGRLEEKKNTAQLVKAFSGLQAPATLVLAGPPGVGYEAVAMAIAQSPRSADILQLGFTSSEAVPILLRQATALVLPSLYEGFGLPVLEAMAAGCPVIAADIPALREVGGEAALFFDPGNAAQLTETMGRVLAQAELRDGLKEKGFKQVQIFSWEKAATATWQAIAK